jgi:hypothetical protein
MQLQIKSLHAVKKLHWKTILILLFGALVFLVLEPPKVSLKHEASTTLQVSNCEDARKVENENLINAEALRVLKADWCMIAAASTSIPNIHIISSGGDEPLNGMNSTNSPIALKMH